MVCAAYSHGSHRSTGLSVCRVACNHAQQLKTKQNAMWLRHRPGLQDGHVPVVGEDRAASVAAFSFLFVLRCRRAASWRPTRAHRIRWCNATSHKQHPADPACVLQRQGLLRRRAAGLLLSGSMLQESPRHPQWPFPARQPPRQRRRWTWMPPRQCSRRPSRRGAV